MQADEMPPCSLCTNEANSLNGEAKIQFKNVKKCDVVEGIL